IRENPRTQSAYAVRGECMKIALFLPNWVGDVVMATPAVRALRRHFAGAHVVGLLRSYVAGVLAGAPWFDSPVVVDPNGPWGRRGGGGGGGGAGGRPGPPFPPPVPAPPGSPAWRAAPAAWATAAGAAAGS